MFVKTTLEVSVAVVGLIKLPEIGKDPVTAAADEVMSEAALIATPILPLAEALTSAFTEIVFVEPAGIVIIPVPLEKET